MIQDYKEVIKMPVKPNELRKIPKLPHGEGNITYIQDRDKLVYRKRVNNKTIAVYGDTVKEVIAKMKEKEKNADVKIQAATLTDAMYDWLKVSKAPYLKPSSYDRIENTIRNQIENYGIGKLRYQQITSDDIQAHLNTLNEEKLSWSSIKKTYDALNNFYNDKIARKECIENPMVTVRMIAKDNAKPIKEIDWMEMDDIKKFYIEALQMAKTGKPIYYLGRVLVFDMFTGLRVGELMALQWQDIDWEEHLVYVKKTVVSVINRQKNATSSHINHVGSTKRYQMRTVYIPDIGYNALKEHFSLTPYKEPTDLVCATSTGNYNTATNVQKQIRRIQKNAGTNKQGSSAHVLRHTCASLLFEQGLEVEKIASILGHSADVCRQTYIHMSEKQRAQAMKKLSAINISIDL
jgi:integrase